MQNHDPRFLLGRVSTTLLTGVALSIGLTACHAAPAPDAFADVVFQSGATKGALTALSGAKAINDPTQAATFTWASTTGTNSFTANPPPVFCWTTGPAGARLENRSNHLDPFFPRSRSPEEHSSKSALELLAPLIGGERAEASTGLTGRAYFVVFTTAKNPKLLRIFTTGHDYVPDDAAMAKLLSANDVIHGTVTAAEFMNDQLSLGPFIGIGVDFTITP
jgi:hypothetical protein